MSKEANKPVAVIVRGEVFNKESRLLERTGKYFEIHIFEIDKKGDPTVIGVTKIGKNEYEKHKIVATLRVPESLLMKLATGERKSAPLWLKQKKW